MVRRVGHQPYFTGKKLLKYALRSSGKSPATPLPKRAYYEQPGFLRSANKFRLEKLGLR